VTVGGVEVDRVVVAHDTSFDAHLASVSMDAGKTIDGSLGGTFLRDFYVTVDYPKHTLGLARYTDTSFLLDQAELIGITLGIDEANDYVVNAATGDAAKKGVTVGDVILAIDGTTLSSVSEIQVEALLYGKVGSTRLVKFGTAATLSKMTVPILVDETLPLPTGDAG
jgi:C-terminal processing protease CtpA/Prc